MKHDGMPFGADGPEDGHEPNPTNQMDGAKGGGMKHVVSPGADEAEKRKHMMLIAMMRAMQGGGAPGGMPMGQPPQGGPPMGQPPMPMGGGGGM